MLSDPTSAVLSGQLLVSIPIALLAGLVSFLSPCILPLLPGYMGLLGGIAGKENSRRRLVAGVALFILGFTAIFVVMNAVVGGVGYFLMIWGDLITRILGVGLILLGIVFLGGIPFLQRTVKPKQRRTVGLWTAPLVGVVFALGWAPCSGPTLAAIGSLSLISGSAWQGALLGLFYSLGLGIPFLAIAFGLGWATKSVSWVRRNIRVINIIGGAMLMLIGVLMVTGVWTKLMSIMQLWMVNIVPVI
ncbi:cytochrome c biogenesis CcdA family protein [Humidisolicoccus flavus]|uniref:cytochrome c biogenesis CcdA family protein n=1 Tax=Humidisolicoccus flavus TaxID=3111414 RepID=UPI00324734BA